MKIFLKAIMLERSSADLQKEDFTTYSCRNLENVAKKKSMKKSKNNQIHIYFIHKVNPHQQFSIPLAMNANFMPTKPFSKLNNKSASLFIQIVIIW